MCRLNSWLSSEMLAPHDIEIFGISTLLVVLEQGLLTNLIFSIMEISCEYFTAPEEYETLKYIIVTWRLWLQINKEHVIQTFIQGQYDSAQWKIIKQIYCSLDYSSEAEICRIKISINIYHHIPCFNKETAI